MAKNSIRDYDATSGNNTDVQSVDISEGCAASGINNALREIMTDLKNVSTGAVALETPAADQLNVDNIRIDGNTISSTDTNGDITLDPDGTGRVAVTGSATMTGTDTFNSNATGSGILLKDSGVTSRQLHIAAPGSVSEAVIGTPNSHNLTFATNNTERMRIASSGFVGIGESAPQKTLHITRNDSDGMIVLDANGTTTDHQICFSKDYGTGGTTGGNYWGIGVDGSENKLVFAYDTNAQASLSADLKVAINSSGELLVGAGSFSNSSNVKRVSAGTIDSARSSTSAVNHITFHNPNGEVGSIFTSSSSTSYQTSSDHRLKEAIIDMTGAIARVKQLAPKQFNFIADPDDTTVDGFLAHEAQAVVPEAVSGTHNEVDDDGNAVMQGIDQSKLVPLLTGALQEAIAKIETLETQRADLETRLTALENA